MLALVKNKPRGCILHGLGYLTLAIVLGAWGARQIEHACNGELIPPLDDTYIYLQYARGAARGEPFSYGPDAPPTRGATSILYPLLLAPFARVMAPDRLPWAAFILGVLCLAGSAQAAHGWATRRIDPRAGPAAGLLVLLSGHFVWGALSGMDIGIYALGLTAALAATAWTQDALDRRTALGRLGVLWCWLLFLGLARPEGIPLGMIVALAMCLVRSPVQSARGRAILVLAPFMALGITAALNLLATGSLQSNSFAAKAVWLEPRPDVRASMLHHLPGTFLRLAWAMVSDFQSRAYFFGTDWLLRGIWIGGVLAAIVAAFRRRASGVRLVLLLFVAALLMGLVPVGFRSHHYRYEIPYIPLAILLALHGYAFALGRRPWRPLIPAFVLGVLLFPGVWRYERTLGLNASNIHDQQVATGRWIDAHLPPEAVVGLNDAGAIAYYGKRRVVDLVGLVTNGSATPNRAGSGSLYEWLERLPVEDRPTHFAIFPAWYPYLIRTNLMGRKLAQFTLGQNTISGGDLKAVYEANWSYNGVSEELWIRRDLLELWGFQVVDTLDVGDLGSEATHGYVAYDTWRDTLREFPVDGHPERMFIEGGRQPTRGERFHLHCRPGQPGALVLRMEAFRPFVLEVHVNGRKLGMWSIPRQPLAWTEPIYEIPGDAFPTTTADIELISVVWEEGPYPSFHYWLLQ
jgi:hypothetical protein